MDVSTYLEKIAKPGDTDLDIDVDGITITAVVRDGADFIVRTVDGFGWWRHENGETFVAPPGDPAASVTELTMSFGWRTCAPFMDGYQSQLETWRDTAVPLRFCAAPGRMSLLMEDEQKWLPLPRSHADLVKDES